MEENARVMVVEDEGIVSIDIRNILKKLGYIISAVAFSGEEAILKVNENPTDLILMDIGLKGNIDGIQAAKKIRSRNKIPVIFLSGFADDNTLKKAQEAKPAAYLLKPINEEELKETIEKIVKSTI